jgi:hypothetical protein
MPGKFDMSDYVPVNERIEAFIKSYPEGSIQSEVVELTASRVTVKAYAYRTPDDPRPGTGHSSLEIPGSTPYTRGSEIENAETSAWGRAIAALGFEVKRGIASREEVSNTQSGQGVEAVRRDTAAAPAPTDKRVILAQLAAEKGIGNDGLQTYAAIVGIKPGLKATDVQLDALIAAVASHGSDEPLELAEPAEPPQRDTDEYKALDARGKAQARSYWASKELEERTPPINPEPEPLELGV